MWRYLLVVFLLPLSLFAATSKDVQGIEAKASSFEVTVYYATDRKATQPEKPLQSPYGAERSKNLTYGTAHVSLPLNHTPGVIEEPRKWKFRSSPRIGRDVVVIDAPAMSRDDFFATVQQQASAGSSQRALVVIHGFWTTFDEAVRRAAQIKKDLEFGGPVIAYTWPSYGGGIFYWADENNAEWTVQHLRGFLLDLSSEVPAPADVIAHSMGNRILAHALESLAANTYSCPTQKTVHLDQVILAAPDIDRDIFCGIADSIKSLANRITVYASRHDQALAISQHLHQSLRAGEGGANVVVLSSVDTIDVGDVDRSILGHSYVFENATVLSDIGSALRGDAIGTARCGFISQTLESLPYWVMRGAGIAAPCVAQPTATSTQAGSPPPVSRTDTRSPSSR